MANSSETFLITGAPGWLGNRFLEVLCGSEGAKYAGSLRQVRCLNLPGSDRRSIEARCSKAKVFEGDVTRKDSMDAFFRGAEGATLFHLAGVIHPGRVSYFYEINLKGTENLMELAVMHGLSKVVYISSNSPLGCNKDGKSPFDENSPYNPYMNYGRSKMLAEILVRGYAERIDATIIRPCWFYGPDQPARQTTFFTMVRKGTFPIVGDGENMRSMTYVDNAVQGMLLAAARPASKGQTYWIADARAYTMNEIVATVGEVLAKDFGIEVSGGIRVPGILGDIAYAADIALQGIGLYNQKVHVMSEMNKHIFCSIEKARAELGYEPAVGLREGMRRSIAACLERGIRI